MTYIKRAIENTLIKVSKMFPAVLITGARQVGKTTLLKNKMEKFPYLTLDDPILLNQAKDDPGSFFKQNIPPIIVDEIQYAPELFPYIKMISDNKEEKGLFYMTGSQKFQMMKNVSESLAGRICILNLCGLSQREIVGDVFNKPFIPTEEYLIEHKKTVKEISYKKVWDYIHTGSKPALYADDMDWHIFYSSYTRTYIERDVKDLTQVGDELKFVKFMSSIAARVSQMLNVTAIANDVGISVTTADRWLSILQASNIIYLLRPFHNNILKRAIKTPKLFFLDTGLAAYLTRWTNSEVLSSGAMSGAFFENYVITEVLKSYYNKGISDPQMYYYRDKDKNEVDLIIELNGKIHPVEIKKTSTPTKKHIKNFEVLENKLKGMVGEGGLICLYNKVLTLDKKNRVIPISFI